MKLANLNCLDLHPIWVCPSISIVSNFVFQKLVWVEKGCMATKFSVWKAIAIQIFYEKFNKIDLVDRPVFFIMKSIWELNNAILSQPLTRLFIFLSRFLKSTFCKFKWSHIKAEIPLAALVYEIKAQKLILDFWQFPKKSLTKWFFKKEACNHMHSCRLLASSDASFC